jgi:hypothetical protein
MKSGDITRSFRCPDPLWDRIEKLAEKRGSTVDSLVASALREYADREEGEPVPAVAASSPPERERRITPFGALLRYPSAPPSPGTLPAGTSDLDPVAVPRIPPAPRTGAPANALRSTAIAGTFAGDVATGAARVLRTDPLPPPSEPVVPPRPAVSPHRDAETIPGRVPEPLPARARRETPVLNRYADTAEEATPCEVPVSRRDGSFNDVSTTALQAPNRHDHTPVSRRAPQLTPQHPPEVESRPLNDLPSTGPAGWVLTIDFMGTSFPVTKDRYIIGRDKHTCDLTIKDPNVSRQHVMIEFHGGRHFVVDLGSTNGIEFLGKKVTRHPIDNGAVYAICDHELRFTYRYYTR